MSRTRRCVESRHVNNKRPCAPRWSEHSRTGAHPRNRDERTTTFKYRGDKRCGLARSGPTFPCPRAADGTEAEGEEATQAFPTQKPSLRSRFRLFRVLCEESSPKKIKSFRLLFASVLWSICAWKLGRVLGSVLWFGLPPSLRDVGHFALVSTAPFLEICVSRSAVA